MKLGVVDGLDIVTKDICSFYAALCWVAEAQEPIAEDSFCPCDLPDILEHKLDFAQQKVLCAIRQNRIKKIYVEFSRDIPVFLSYLVETNRKEGLLDFELPTKDICSIEPSNYEECFFTIMGTYKGVSFTATDCYLSFDFEELATVFKRDGVIKEYIEQVNKSQTANAPEDILNANVTPQEAVEEYKRGLDLDNRPLFKICLELAEQHTAEEYVGTKKKQTLIEELVRATGKTENEANMIVTLLMSDKSRKGGQKAIKPKK